MARRACVAVLGLVLPLALGLLAASELVRWHRALTGEPLAVIDWLWLVGFRLLQPLDGTKLLPGRDFQVPSSLEGKVAMITGGTQGIGLGVAKRFHGLGADVVLSGRSTGSCSKAVAEIRAATDRWGRTAGFPVDQADFVSVRSFVAQVVAEFPRLDFLILNAGRTHAGDKNSDDSAWLAANGQSKIFTINYLGHFLMALTLAPALAPGASVLVLSSIEQWWIDPRRLTSPPRTLPAKHEGRWAMYGFGMYQRSKLALRCFALSLRPKAARRNIRVLGLTPGQVNTGMLSWLKKRPELNKSVPVELGAERMFEAAFITGEPDFVSPYWMPRYLYALDADVRAPRWRGYRDIAPATTLRAHGLRHWHLFPWKYQFESAGAWTWRAERHQALDFSLHRTAAPDCPEELREELWRWSRKEVGLPERLDDGDIFTDSPA